MKLFKNITKWLNNQEYLFFLFILVLVVPNIFLCFTESMSWVAKVCNVLLPLSCYYLLMTLMRNCGRMFWILFPLLFLGAFQTVLLYLFGRSIIAVDMFLNLATTNSGEAMELLDNLIPALIGVFVIYVPALTLAVISIIRKRQLSDTFLRKQRRYASIAVVVGFLSLGATFALDKKYELTSELYPVNVCYNIKLAFDRDIQTRNYAETSKNFTFHAQSTHSSDAREIYVFVVGETARALNWGLYGYTRDTNPQLSKIPSMTVFSDVLTQSNTTHKSVPMLISDVSAENFDSIYHQKSILTAFKEAGYRTAFFSNQRYNDSFIDFFGQEAAEWKFIKEDSAVSNTNPSDDELLSLVEKEIDRGDSKLFIVLHTYGSHFNYRERYPAKAGLFQPDSPADAKLKYRDNLINAYDNSIRYTDDFLARLITLLSREEAQTAMLYTSDHGEDIFDDDRRLFLHASPVPSYYQLHVPFVVWTSDTYKAQYSDVVTAMHKNRLKPFSSNNAAFHTLLTIGGIQSPYRDDSRSVASPLFTERPRYYLNDHNKPCALDDIGMDEVDFEMFRKQGIKF